MDLFFMLERSKRKMKFSLFLKEYESGKAIPNPALISKMEKILGTKLRDSKK